MIVYSKDSCPHCVGAKALLDSKNVAYTEIKIGRDITLEEFKDTFPHVKTVPHIIDGSYVIGGFSDLREHFKS